MLSARTVRRLDRAAFYADGLGMEYELWLLAEREQKANATVDAMQYGSAIDEALARIVGRAENVLMESMTARKCQRGSRPAGSDAGEDQPGDAGSCLPKGTAITTQPIGMPSAYRAGEVPAGSGVPVTAGRAETAGSGRVRPTERPTHSGSNATARQ